MAKNGAPIRPAMKEAEQASSFLDNAAYLVSQEKKKHRLTPEQIAWFNEFYAAKGEFLLVQRLDDEEERTKGGVIKGKQTRDQRGVVILAGESNYLPGQTVLITKFGGTDAEIQDRNFLIVHYKQIYLTELKTPDREFPE